MADSSRMSNASRSRGRLALGLIVALLLAPCGAAFAASNPAEDAVMVAFSDNMENGPANWVIDTAIPLGAPWAIIVGPNHSPTHSFFTDDPSNISDKRVAFANAVVVPAGSTLSFWYQWNTEPGFDGSVLEYSLNGGTTWTDILLGQGSVPADPNRITQTPYNTTISTSFQSPIAGRRAWAGNSGTFQEVRVNMTAFAGVSTKFRWRFASDNSVSATGVWLDDVQIAASLEPVSLVIDASGNGVLEPAENVVMAPTWRNTTAAAISPTGALSNFTGPAGPNYVISDPTAAYGSIAAGGTGTCTSDCYSVAITGATRPTQHWDASARETLTPGGITKDWTLHVGDSFSDVPRSSPFYRFIETILHKDVTGGCSATEYCPTNPTTREQMAVFVLVAKEPPGYTPPACGATPMFADVPVSSPFCRWIEELANRGVVSGCGGGNYCPTSSVTRDAMAVFVLLVLDPAMNPPACTAGSEMFSDVPASNPFCRWIEELARRGVVTGCGGGAYCPTSAVTREQMGVFLSTTFSLVLYGG